MNSEVVKILQNGSDEQILHTLRDCRLTGSNMLIAELMNLLDRTHNILVHKEVAGILNDLNEQSSADELMKHLPLYKTHAIFAELVGACWQNNLDYSGYIDFFIEIVLEGDYASAIEAFTVVENNISHLDSQKRESLAWKIDKAKEGIPEEKATLVKELYRMIKTFYDDFRLDLS